MTNEQKPESAEFRTQAMEELCAAQDFYDRVVSSSPDEQIAVGQDHHTRLERAVRAVIAEARGASEREAQDIEEAKDEGANYVLTSLALLFGRDGFEIRDGSETWEGDVNATLEGILKAGGLVDDEGDLLDLTTLKDRLAEQRWKDVEGAERWEFEEPEYHVQGMGCGLEDHSIHDRYEAMAYGWDQAVERCIERIPEELYTRPANVAALEARVKELEGEGELDRRIAEAVAAERERCAQVCEKDAPKGNYGILGNVGDALNRAAAAIREGGE